MATGRRPRHYIEAMGQERHYMQSKSLLVMCGALAGTAITIALYAWLQSSWAAVAAIGSLVLIGYVVAAFSARSLLGVTATAEFMRGFLVGINAAASFIIASMLLGAFAGASLAILAGATLGAVILLTAFGPLSRVPVFKSILGYGNWLLPMSWPIVAVGMLFVFCSCLFHVMTAGKVSYLRIQAARIHWQTGTLFIKGGLFANLNLLKTAFNMGNFTFVHRDATSWHVEHEIGHSLNLATFGSLFHLLGALDENATPRGQLAYAERLAESNCERTERPVIAMWA